MLRPSLVDAQAAHMRLVRGAHLLARPVQAQLPLLQPQHARVVAHIVQHVGRDQHLLRAGGNVGGQPQLAGQIQAGVGLVQQQHLGLGHPHGQPAHPLALALA